MRADRWKGSGEEIRTQESGALSLYVALANSDVHL
jgi:hypothetical protein